MYITTIFDNRALVGCVGRIYGNFNPKQGEYDLLSRLRPIVQLTAAPQRGDICSLKAPSLGFTNRWVEWSSDDTGEAELYRSQTWRIGQYGLWRTSQKADGVVIKPQETSSMLLGFNADCPFGAILWPDGKIGFCHLGLECILPKNGSPGILNTAGLESRCQVYVMPGIGPCCYGRNDDAFDYVFQRYPGAESHAKNSARAGQPSLNLSRLITWRLTELGVQPGNIHIDLTCTACAQTPDGQPLYFSNVRDRGTPLEGGRNCVFVKRI